MKLKSREWIARTKERFKDGAEIPLEAGTVRTMTEIINALLEHIEAQDKKLRALELTT